MKTYWKWIFGLVIFLAVIAAIPLGMRYMIGNGYITGPSIYAWRQAPTVTDFDRPYKYDGWNDPHGFYSRNDRDPHGRGLGFFGPFIFFGGLLKLVIFGGLLYGAYWLGRRNARIALDPVPVPAPKRGGRSAKNG